MRPILIAATLGVAISLLPSSADACTPPARGEVNKSPPRRNVKTVSANVLIRFVALESASFRETARARVLEARRGPFTVGQVILVKPMPGSICGPERIVKGASGWIETVYSPKRRSDPLPFFGFTKPRKK